MKKILSFLAGALTAACLIIIGIFIFLRTAPVESPDSQNVLKALSPASNEDGQIRIAGTLSVPNGAKLYRPGEGRVRVSLSYGPMADKKLFLAPPDISPNFPLRFVRQISQNEWNAIKQDAQGIFFLQAHYSPKTNVISEWQFNPWEPSLTIMKPIGEALQKGGKEFDLGNVELDILYSQAHSEPCRPNAALLAGKVTVGEELKAKFPSGKAALVVYLDEPFLPRPNSATVSEAEFDKNALSYLELDLSKGPANFSIPAKETFSSLLKVMLAACEPGENVKACAMKTFPPLSAPLRLRGKVFQLLNGSEVPVCGTTNVNGILHP